MVDTQKRKLYKKVGE